MVYPQHDQVSQDYPHLPARDRLAGSISVAHKVDVEVEGVKIRALVDNGSQVTLVTSELLPKVKEHNNWTL